MATVSNDSAPEVVTVDTPKGVERIDRKDVIEVIKSCKTKDKSVWHDLGKQYLTEDESILNRINIRDVLIGKYYPTAIDAGFVREAVKEGYEIVVSYALPSVVDIDKDMIVIRTAVMYGWTRIVEKFPIMPGLASRLLAVATSPTSNVLTSNVEMMKTLISRGADIHFDDDAALLAAINNDNPAAFKFLVDNGANVKKINVANKFKCVTGKWITLLLNSGVDSQVVLELAGDDSELKQIVYRYKTCPKSINYSDEACKIMNNQFLAAIDHYDDVALQLLPDKISTDLIGEILVNIESHPNEVIAIGVFASIDRIANKLKQVLGLPKISIAYIKQGWDDEVKAGLVIVVLRDYVDIVVRNEKEVKLLRVKVGGLLKVAGDWKIDGVDVNYARMLVFRA